MSEAAFESDFTLVETKKAELKSLWIQAFVAPAAQPGSTVTQAFIAGVNVRFHLKHALKAVWETSRAVVAGTKALHTPFEVWSWLEFGAEASAAVQSVVESLVQRISAVDYVTAVVLSDHFASEAISPDTLKKEVEDFLADPNARRFAWYLGMRGSKLKEAQDAVLDEDWFQLCQSRLQNLGFVSVSPVSGALTFTEIGFEVGIRSF